MSDQNHVVFPPEFFAVFPTASTSSCPTAPCAAAAPSTAPMGPATNAPAQLSSILNQTVQVDTFTDALLRCMEEAVPAMLFPVPTPQKSQSLVSAGTTSVAPFTAAAAPTLAVTPPAVPY
ncbi:hypothetical protein AAVH_32074, partial [Aphelenchoides avenae]